MRRRVSVNAILTHDKLVNSSPPPRARVGKSLFQRVEGNGGVLDFGPAENGQE